MTSTADITFDPARGNRRRWFMLGLAATGFILSQFYRASIAVISPQLVAELQLSSSQISFIVAAFFYSFAALQIPMGLSLDRIGPRRTMGVLGVLGVVGSVLFATAHDYQQAVLGRVFMGLGMGCNLMGMMALVAAWFPINRFAFLAGIAMAMGNLGGLFAATPLQMVTDLLGWRGSFLAIAGINAVQVLLLVIVVRDRPQGAADKKTAPLPKLNLARLSFFITYSYWAVSLGTFVRYGYFIALQGLWAAPFMVFGLGYSSFEMANVILALNLGMMVGLPFWGKLSDQILHTRKHIIWPWLFSSALIVLSLSILGKQTPVWVAIALMFTLGFSSSSGQVMYAHVKELVPSDQAGQVMTGINLFTMLGGAVFSQILGFLLPGDPASLTSPDDYSVIFWLGGSCLILVGLMYLFVPESKAMHKARQKDKELKLRAKAKS
jgi:MFS family permease